MSRRAPGPILERRSRGPLGPVDKGPVHNGPLHKGLLHIGLVLIGLVLMGLAAVASLAIGPFPVAPDQALIAVFAPDGSVAHTVVQTTRVPRTGAAIAVGAALGVSGAILQTITRNPLAAPGLLGVNAGAALAVVALTVVWEGPPPLAAAAGVAVLGAAAAAMAVWLLAARTGMAAEPTPLRLTLAGAALTLLLTALTTALLLMDARALDETRLWLAGSVAGRPADLVARLGIAIAVALGAALALARVIAVLGLGREVALGLGVGTAAARAGAIAVATTLAGLAVALAGPVGFVGLAAPHMARALAGADPGRVLVLSAPIGATILLAADIAARSVAAPQETPVGVATALFGVPVFIALLRRRRSWA
ncbi:MAG: iron ABC transporter permease [Pseudomonadota bacterium]